MYVLKRAARLMQLDAVLIALVFASAAGIGIMNLLIQHAVPAEVLFQSILPRAPLIAFELAFAAAVLRSLRLDNGSAAGAITCATTYVWVHWGQPSVWDLPLEQIPARLAVFAGCVIVTSTVVVFCYNQCFAVVSSRLESSLLPLPAVLKLRHIIAVLVVALLVPATQAISHEGDDAAFGHHDAADNKPVPVFGIGGRAAGLKIERVQRGAVWRTLSVFGTVQAADNKTVEVRPTGDVVKLLVRQGDTVARGTPLAVIRSADISTLLSDLVRERQSIEREIDKAKTEIGGGIATQSILVESTRVEFEREKILKQKGITTDVVFLAVKTKLDSEKSKLVVLEKQLNDALKRLNERLKVITKTAKSKAVSMGLSEKDFEHAVEAGDATADVLFLSPAAGLVATIPGDTLDVQKRTFVIIDPSQVWVVLDVPESDLATVHIGQHVSLNIGDRTITGAISSMGGSIDAASRTLAARVVLDNGTHKLIPGLPVTGDIVIEQTSVQALVIPLSALIEEDGAATVYVRQANHLFKAVEVETGLRNATMVEITAGLNESDNVVVAGARQLHAQKHLGRGQSTAHEHEHGHGHGHDHGHSAAHAAPGLSKTAMFVLLAGLAGAVALALNVVRRQKK